MLLAFPLAPGQSWDKEARLLNQSGGKSLEALKWSLVLPGIPSLDLNTIPWLNWGVRSEGLQGLCHSRNIRPIECMKIELK